MNNSRLNNTVSGWGSKNTVFIADSLTGNLKFHQNLADLGEAIFVKDLIAVIDGVIEPIYGIEASVYLNLVVY